MRTAVVTIVSGRHDHLRAQQLSLATGDLRPDLVVVVSMGDPEVHDVVSSGPFGDDAGTCVLDVPVTGHLPLSRARNTGALEALQRGADLLVFLDVDCLASEALLSSYASAAERLRPGAVLSGPVGYLPQLPPGRSTYDEATRLATPPHPARPAPPTGHLEAARDTRLFWSLSFAVRAQDWAGFGGFDEGYTGYGGEDTDFGQRVAAAGGRLWWVGGATAHHQWHPVSRPPVEHLDDIVRNANRFHRRWGWFPMEGWLEEFRVRRLARHDPRQDAWTVLE
ncbi:MAG: galactosyltransferase-related protein [Nocardioidaceae bacterium]